MSSRGPAGRSAPVADADAGHDDARGRGRARVGLDAAHACAACPAAVNADALAIPVGEVLGWLVAAGAGQVGDDIGASVRWLGRVAIWAVELTARGAMVPQLRRRTRRSGERTGHERLVLGALDARARRSRRASNRWPRDAGQRCSRSTATSTRAR